MLQHPSPKQLELLKADFKNFLYYVWKFLGLPDPTPVQYELADFLQYGPKRKMIEAFRGIGKSWITSAYVLWRLLKNPQLKFLVVSASKARSDDFTAFTKRLIHEMPVLQHLKAKEGQRDTMIAFDVGPAIPAHAPSVKSVGIFGQLTGSRADDIIADDIEVAQNSQTEDAREKLAKATTEFEAILVPLPGASITYLGTPQSEESIYNKLTERGYKVQIWPARYPSLGKVDIYKGNLAETIVEALENRKVEAGDPVDPLRFNATDLIEREAAYGRSGFTLQFMLDTTLSDQEKYPLKTSDLIVMPLNLEKAPVALQYGQAPELQIKDYPNIGFTGDRWHRPRFIEDKWAPYEGSVMFIDPSGRGSDETGYAVVKQLHGYLFLTAIGGLKGGYDDNTLKHLAVIARDHQVNITVIESNFGDGMFEKLYSPVLNKYHPKCGLEEVRHSTQKERRIIDTLEPVLNRHKLVVDSEIVRADILLAKDNPRYSLFYQLTRITKDRGSLRHDDRLEALYGAVAYWVESMSRDIGKAVESFENKLLDKELATFKKHVVGRNSLKNTAPKWTSVR